MLPPHEQQRRAESGAVPWPPLARFVALEERVAAAMAARGPWGLALYEFLRFGVKQGWACLFGAAMLALPVATHLWYPRNAPLPRYDALLLAALDLQAALLALRMETWEEARVILVFHLTGTAMEVFKTAHGSWVYPEPGLLRVGGVPLFTGFMYAAVGSHMPRAWRLLDFRLTGHPPFWATMALAAAVYVNFFNHRFVGDARLGLFALAAIMFGRCRIHFRVWREHRWMPLLLGLLLVAGFNQIVGLGQRAGWRMVSPVKLGPWFLLAILSWGLVLAVHRAAAFPPRARAGAVGAS